MATIRLLKVVLQPVFVVESDEGLEERTGQPVMVNGKDWPTVGERFFGEVDMAVLQAQLDAEHPADEPTETST